ncbi:MAG TPA: type II toxin-antitoxin system HicB family antitoxin [Azospirillum sp.]|nr:type II toxin-antitoxin system HicB family antitoxin [Azospirillum sp.]
MDPRAYPVIVRPSAPEDGVGFVAEIPDLPGCTSTGQSPAEAIENVQGAIISWIEEARRLDQPVPPPSKRFRMITE